MIVRMYARGWGFGVRCLALPFFCSSYILIIDMYVLRIYAEKKVMFRREGVLEPLFDHQPHGDVTDKGVWQKNVHSNPGY
jgi:hypothetical protein